MATQRTFIDLFSGCGGLSLGLINAGWNAKFALEINPDAFDTYKHNLLSDKEIKFKHNWPSWLPQQPHNIRSVLRKHSKSLAELKGRVTLVAGGPPCQGFSSLGLRDGSDARNDLIKDYIRFVNLVQPRFVLLENVSGIQAAHHMYHEQFNSSKKPTSGAGILYKKLSNNYHIQSDILKAADFGVPQSRPRFIAFGIRKDLLLKTEECPDIFNILKEVRVKFLREKGLSQLSLIHI